MIKQIISKGQRHTTISILSRLNSTTSTHQADEGKSTTTEQSQEASEKKNDNYYDIIVCGGGMVGTAMTAALGNEPLFQKLKIALIESMPRNEYTKPVVHENRVSALNDHTIKFFKSLGSFDFIEKNRYGTVKHMHVWDARSDASISFNNPDGSNLALIVENNLIQESLTQNIKNYPNVKVFYSTQINDFHNVDHFIELKLNNSEPLRTKLLIGSDGGNSFIRKKCNFGVTQRYYDQIAIVGTLKLSEPTANITAWQRFLPTGPIALLPLDDNHSSLVWSIKKEFVNELLKADDEQFVHKVNQAFIEDNYKNDSVSKIENFVQNGLDALRTFPQLKDVITDRESVARFLPPKIEACLPKSRASFPLSMMHAHNYVADRVALIGDAIHKVHPLAGQGVNLGFSDVTCLTEILVENYKNGGDIGSIHSLKKFESKQQLEAFIKVFGIDALNVLYTDHNYIIQTPLAALRTIGLTLSNRIDPLKDFYKKKAIN